MSRPRSRRHSGWWIVASLVAMLALAGLGWRISGGSWHRVETPSMGTVAPVGSLLWVRPVQIEELKVGDFITFRQPSNSGVTISHLVQVINPDGSITTKGVFPAADPWRLTQADLVGRVVAVWWGVGALVEALPILVVGSLLLASLRLLLRTRWRDPVTLVGVAVTIVIALLVHRPLVNAQQLANQPTPQGAKLTFVGTGLLPTRVSEPSGGSVVVRSGEVGTLEVPFPATPSGEVTISMRAAVGWWWWLVIAASCLLPAGWTMLKSRRRRVVDDDEPVESGTVP